MKDEHKVMNELSSIPYAVWLVGLLFELWQLTMARGGTIDETDIYVDM